MRIIPLDNYNRYLGCLKALLFQFVVKLFLLTPFVSNFFAKGDIFYFNFFPYIFAAGDNSCSVIVNFLNYLDELTSFNANNAHFKNQAPFRSGKRHSHEVW
jgi:hypothetical protein